MPPHDWPAFLSLVKRIVVANRNIAIEREQAQPLVASFLFHVKRCSLHVRLLTPCGLGLRIPLGPLGEPQPHKASHAHRLSIHVKRDVVRRMASNH